MGTTRSGRYLNTKGSGRSISHFALVHSNEGNFTKPNYNKNERLRLKSGGHGQKGMDLLDKHGIKYNIVKTYPNGVRIGNIPDHKQKAKQKGTGQAWFPKKWTEKDIKRAGEHVASLRQNRHIPNGKTVFGVYKGVRVGVIKTNGQPGTIFPDSDQSSVLRKRRKA